MDTISIGLNRKVTTARVIRANGDIEDRVVDFHSEDPEEMRLWTEEGIATMASPNGAIQRAKFLKE